VPWRSLEAPALALDPGAALDPPNDRFGESIDGRRVDGEDGG
jgi:hypothetical protein